MKITTVGMSERQYFVKDDEKAYVVLNSQREKGYPVYVCRKHTGSFVKTYKTLVGAQKFLTSNGFIERI